MNVLQIALLGIAAAAAVLILKNTGSDYVPMVTVAFTVIVFIALADRIGFTFDVIKKISDVSGIKNDVTALILKVAAISLIAEFAAGICTDSGQPAIGERIVSAGKIIILALAMPVVTEMLEECFALLK